MKAETKDQTALLEKVIPSNIEAEQVLLGSLLINNELHHRVSDFLKASHFYEVLHQKIYHAIEVVMGKGLSANSITLKNMLDKDSVFEQVGGNSYLTNLASMAITIINPYDYGKLIYDLALKRSLIEIGEDIVNIAYASTLDTKAVEQIENAENKLYLLAAEGVSDRGFLNINESISISLDSINRAMKSSEHIVGISTGLIDLDDKLFGFHNSDLSIIAGRPSMGKTAFAINLAINACKSLALRYPRAADKPSVGFFSLEMSAEQLATRLLSMQTKIDSSALRSGKINEEHYNQLRKQAHELSQLPLFIDDTPSLSIAAIRSRARKLKRKNNLSILFIDYLQLIRGSNNSANRVLEITEITQGLKALAKELNIPVIALSQLSRAVETRVDNRPMLSDLRESGSIEQDSDVVMFIYREEYYLARKQPSQGTDEHIKWQTRLNEVHNVTEIIISKHRNGPVGTVQIYYDTHHSKFTNLNKIN